MPIQAGKPIAPSKGPDKVKKRIVLIPITLTILIFLLVSVLSASEGTVTEDAVVYLPLVRNVSDQVFRDDFSNDKSGWPVVDNGLVRWSYQDGEYEMLIREAGRWAGAIAPVDGLTAYNVRASMRRQQGRTGDYGLVFDWKDWDNFYFLAMDPSGGWFGVAKVVFGEPEIVIPRTDAAVILPGYAQNRLRIDREGLDITVSINGKRLATVQDKEFSGDVSVGFYMEADEDVPARARYDNIEVWRLGTGQLHEVKMRPMGTYFSGGDDFDAALNWER